MSYTSAVHLIVSRMVALIERPLFNALWFNALWFALVVGRDDLLFLSVGLLVFHGVFVERKSHEYRLLALIAGIGMAIDSALSLSGVFVFQDDAVIPWWLACLWLAFAATLSRSLRFFAPHIKVSIVMGAIAGPMSYWAGHQFGAVDFSYSLLSTLLLLSVIWAALLPLLLRASLWCERAQRIGIRGMA